MLTITISEVQMSPDLRHATAFVMPLGGQDREEILTALHHAAPFLRGLVAKEVRLKYAPALHFRIDTSFDTAQRIDALLRTTQTSPRTDDPESNDTESGPEGGGDDSADSGERSRDGETT